MSRPILFNPIRANEDELEATLVARRALLEEIERAVVDDAKGPSVRHWLIVAPRGSGKSHFSEVLARRMRRLGDWSVVRLPEEAYRVSTLADLLAWIVGALEGEARPFGDEVDQARIEALAESRLRRWRERHGPILVIVENLNELLGRRFNRTSQARLRALLMGDPPFTLVATSTRMFGEVQDHGAPFYDFFQERRLDELAPAQVAELVERRATYEGARDILDRLDEVRPRLAALYHLSGGNPRLVLALYGVLRQGLTRDLYDQLLQLLDDVTPYYQARLHDASPQGSRVLAEMAMAEGPLVPSEIGRRCGLKTNQVTAVLSQLEEERFVRPGGRPKDKRSRYWEVTDRLLRIWLQMREEGDARANVRWVVEFYQRWYEGDWNGLLFDAQRIAHATWESGAHALQDMERTLRHMSEAAPAEVRALVQLVGWVGEHDPLVAGEEAELKASWEGGSRERRVALAVPLARCALERQDLQAMREALAPAIAARRPEAVVPWAFAHLSPADSQAGLDSLAELRRQGWARRPAVAGIMLLNALSGKPDTVLDLFREETEDRADTMFFGAFAVGMMLRAGRADLAVDIDAAARRHGIHFDSLLGPGALLARFAAGLPVACGDLDRLSAWCRTQRAKLVRPNVVLGILRWVENAATDADAARCEALLPEEDVAVRACVRAIRAFVARAEGRPFDIDFPTRLAPGAVETEWRKLNVSQMTSLPSISALSGVQAIYVWLRDVGLLPTDLPIWSDAARVAASDDKEAALAALHPEVREAVLLLLNERPEA